eukprot:3091888-Pyramimonas_sp.AAC.1
MGNVLEILGQIWDPASSREALESGEPLNAIVHMPCSVAGLPCNSPEGAIIERQFPIPSYRLPEPRPNAPPDGSHRNGPNARGWR